MWERDEVDNGKWGMASGGFVSSTANTATAPELTNGYIMRPRIRRKTKVHVIDLPRPMVGLRTVSVPHGPDGSVHTVPVPSPFVLDATQWTDGGRAGLHPSTAVAGRPSRCLDGLYG